MRRQLGHCSNSSCRSIFWNIIGGIDMWQPRQVPSCVFAMATGRRDRIDS
jgi:hypothetical protein